MTNSIIWGRLVEDFQKKGLLPLKFVFFIHASTILVLYPYLTIHMRELGINVRETAIMSAVTPIIAILMPPIAGMMADRIGNFRVLLATFSTLGGPLALLLLFVPVGRLTITYPSTVILEVGCNANKILSLGVDERNYSCIPAHPYQYDITGQIEACGLACDTSPGTNVHGLLSAVEVQVSLDNLEIYQYYPKQDIHDEAPLKTSVVSRRLKNNELFDDSVRFLGTKRVFFPMGYGFNCKENSDKVVTCEFAENVTESIGGKFRATVLPKKEKSLDEEEDMMRKFQVIAWGKQQIEDKTMKMCGSGNYVSATVVVPGNKQKTELQCQPRCIATAPRKLLCDNLQVVQERNVKLTFWLYLSIRVLIGIVGGTTFAMFEGAVIALLREHKADYGLQRVYATVGGMISSPLSGWLIEWASQGKDYTDFRPAFYLYAFLKVTTGLLLLTIRLDFKPPAKNVVTDFKTVLRNPEMIGLLLACFVLGTAWGYIESFLFWLIQDLGGSSSLMGITITIGGVFGIPLLILSGPIIDKIGHANVLFVGMIFYAVRLTGYSLIYNPWYCLIFEAMESVTTGLAFTAAVTYAAKLSTTTTDTSIQGLLGGLYFGVGKGSGSLIGGFLISAIGSRETYQVFATFTTAYGICYALFNHFYLRKHAIEGNEIMKKEPAKVMEFKAIKVGEVNEKKVNGILTNENDKLGNTGENLRYQKSENDKDEHKECQNSLTAGTENPTFESDTEAQHVNKSVNNK